MIVGFTGTRRGMTERQRVQVAAWLALAHRAHHGDCTGADEEFHELCRQAGVAVVLHPPLDARLRAFCKGAEETRLTRPYLERDHDIVDECAWLIAAPFESYEPRPARGQGTWSTVRYARQRRRLIRVAWP